MSTTAREEIQGRIKALASEIEDAEHNVGKWRESIERSQKHIKMLTRLRREYIALVDDEPAAHAQG